MLTKDNNLYIAHCEEGAINLCGKMANRHGLVAGATGTGKTVTLQVLAETFCQAGVPCFMADMKGDLSGISRPGAMSSFIEKRCPEFGIENPQFEGCPVRFYDVYGEQGHPMRTTISNMGPQLLARLLDLNETQTGVLNIVFRIADERGLLLIDIKDLRSMLNYVSEHHKEYTTKYGMMTSASIGAIQRSLLSLEDQGGNLFFAEPSFDIFDLLANEGGRGVMSVLAADKLMLNPKLYSTFLLWLLSDLYAQLPEVGDMDLPRLVFFFDEAHMLFTDTSKALIEKIEQVIRLIRSKGVGVYFVTQYPTDLPESILGQLGNRVQHALRAYTPKDQKAVKVSADTFRPNPKFDTSEAITQLGTGEALVSFLDEKGIPGMVQRAKILFPLSQIGAISSSEREMIINRSRIYGKYDKMIDRESAFEILLAESEAAAKAAEAAAAQVEAERRAIEAARQSERTPARGEKAAKVTKKSSKGNKSLGKVVAGALVTSATAAVGSAVGKEVKKAVKGKSKSGSVQSSAGNAIGNAASSATRSILRSILGNLVK
jgi:DNA helicase HerA-like ATPase